MLTCYCKLRRWIVCACECDTDIIRRTDIVRNISVSHRKDQNQISKDSPPQALDSKQEYRLSVEFFKLQLLILSLLIDIRTGGEES